MLNFFIKKNVGEPILGPFVTYPGMKKFYIFEVIDLGYQVDHATPKNQLTGEQKVLLTKLVCL